MTARAALLGLLLLPTAQAGGSDVVAVKAGTIHLVEDGRVLKHGTILLRGDKIAAVGENVDVPSAARVGERPTDSANRSIAATASARSISISPPSST